METQLLQTTLIFTFSGVTNADPDEIDEQGFVCTLDGEPVGDPIR